MKNGMRGVLTLVASGGIVAAMTVPALASAEGADAAPNGEVQQIVDVVGNGSSVHLSDASLFSGSIGFRVSTTAPQTQNGGGSSISLFALKPGKTLADVTRSLHEEFSNTPSIAAKGTRDILATADIFGLADVVPGHAETVTEFLQPGHYWVMDIANLAPTASPQFSRVDVDADGGRNIEQDSDRPSQVHVSTVDEHFDAPTTWPHEGTYRFTNNADTIHFMNLQPVKPGTTDQQVQEFFDSMMNGTNNVPPPFIAGPTGGNDVVSPGNSLQVSYDMPPGTYVMVCFVADEQTGIPHAFMGMHKVITLQ